MDPRLLSGLVPENYARQGCEALAKRQKLVTSLLSERRLMPQGWDAATIERLLQARPAVVKPSRHLQTCEAVRTHVFKMAACIP